MTFKTTFTALAVFLMAAGLAGADTFRHKETGETFNGFATQQSSKGLARVYNSDQGGFTNIALDEYEVTYNPLGRKDRAVLVQITSPEILLSEAVSNEIVKTIQTAANTGPQLIILQIDCPGGRSEYMSAIATAVLQTDNCPIAAFISGKDTGGAFAAAAVLAMAADRVYMAPGSVIGAVGPVPSNLSDEDYKNYMDTYSPESLSSPYMVSYLKNIAQAANRPPLLVRALADKYVSVVEVANQDGSRNFIQREDLQPTQTVVRTLSEGLQKAGTDPYGTVGVRDLTGSILMLSSSDAEKLGLITSTAADVKDVIAAYNLADVKVAGVPGLDKLIKQFTANRRNIAQGLTQIQYLEEQAQTLENQFKTLEAQLATSLQTREVSSGSNAFSSATRKGLPSRISQYYDTQIDPGVERRSGEYRETNLRNRRTSGQQQTTITTTEPQVSVNVIQSQLISVLRDLLSEYRRVANIAKRDPGALPPEVTVSMLQENGDAALQEIQRLSNYQPLTPTRTQQRQYVP